MVASGEGWHAGNINLDPGLIFEGGKQSGEKRYLS